MYQGISLLYINWTESALYINLYATVERKRASIVEQGRLR